MRASGDGGLDGTGDGEVSCIFKRNGKCDLQIASLSLFHSSHKLYVPVPSLAGLSVFICNSWYHRKHFKYKFPQERFNCLVISFNHHLVDTLEREMVTGGKAVVGPERTS